MNLLFVSLGCDKNLVDTEVMLGILKQKGFSFTDDENEADVIAINTCCFVDDAKQESIDTILEMSKLKETGRCKALIVSGCMAQRYKEEIIEEIPEVDAVLGTSTYDHIAETILSVLEGKEYNIFEDLNRLPDVSSDRVVTTGGFYEYLKIAEGCDKNCTYCIIPKVRGNYRSIPMEKLLEDTKKLVAAGVKEVILVAQETTLYGMDLYGKKSLPELLHRLCQIKNLEWVRILYCYPEEITDELIQVMKQEPKVCNYLDIPIQHASDAVLKRMGRRTTKQELMDIINKLREELPDIALRTTLITGFPGETQEQHEELMDFVDDMEFERLGVFTYSQEEGTPAAEISEQISQEVKNSRRDEIMELQQQISLDKSQNMIGKVLNILIEGKIADENAYVGRSYMDAPNVDGLVFVHTDEELMSGEFARVRITGALEYDLIGEINYEFAQ